MKNKDKAVLAAVLILFAAPVAAILLIDFPEAGFDHYMTDVGIEVRGDGSLAVTEAYSFRWSGVDSGEMYITFSGEKRAALVESSVECMIDGTPAELVSYSAGSNASHAGFGGAMYARGPNPVSGDWEANAFYKRASSGEHTVSFSYVLEGAFAAYADCVDIYYKVFTTFQHDLADLTVTVSMPAGSLQGSTRIFGHGDPNGYCEFVGGSADAVFKSPMLPAYTMFEIRVVSQQTDLYPAAPAGAGKTFASIMEEERKFLEDTERDVLLAKIQILLIVAMVASTLLALLAMSRLLPRNKPGFDQPYTREIPPVKPNVAARLARYRGLNMQSGMGDKITAAVLDLALRGSIAIEKGAGGEITFVSLDQPVQLTRFERGVRDMLFCGAGGSPRVTLGEVKKAVEGGSADHIKLSTADKAEFDACGYVDHALGERNSRWRRAPLLPLALAAPIIGISIGIDYFDYIPHTMFSVFALAVLSIFTAERMSSPLTARGEDDRARVLALRRFYTDMTLMRERRAMELPLWEQHMVYATALGVADKVAKELEVRFAEQTGAAPYIGAHSYLFAMYGAGGLSAGLSSINKVSNAAYIRGAGASGGYSGGGGGGFTGGGGGGFGGGGGGHR